ncbi:MAG: hypothetical protein EA369_07830 [Bradymonadales bacterium]|nr:MAG: hypothetical protein EA369_07830 [Bradymonadales bacterium]
MSDLFRYLRRQKRLYEFYRGLFFGQLALLGLALSFSVFALVQHFWAFVAVPAADYSRPVLVVLTALWALWFLWVLIRKYQGSFESVARVIEAQAVYFRFHPEAKTELQSAAYFLNKKQASDFERAHLDRWTGKVGQLPAFIWPSRNLAICFVLACSFIGVSWVAVNGLEYRAARAQLVWLPSDYEIKIPREAAEWESRSGTLAGVMNSRFRFEAPQLGFWQAYLFTREEGRDWTARACGVWCEGTIQGRAQYAVGSLLNRSPAFPIQLLDDEPPRARIFLRDGQDLVPHPRLNILNSTRLSLQLLAHDDFGIESLVFVHEFGDSETELLRLEDLGTNFREDFELKIEDWPGGTHALYLLVRDQMQEVRSQSLIIQYADEEYMREMRNQNIRAYLDQWIHVLADLLESKTDQRLATSLEQNLGLLGRPDVYEHDLFEIWVAEMQGLQSRIERQVLRLQQLREIPAFVRELERQILYALSLLFQEKAGDVHAAKDSVRATQQDLAALLEEIRQGKESLSSEKMQEAFERLAAQLEDLRERMRNLPQGPQDQHVNREAIEEQISQSQELEDRIAEIKRLASMGQDELALRELESLTNQLSILTQEIERGLEQWEENLAQGAMQASESYERALQELSERQQRLLERTQEWQEQGESLDEEFKAAPEEAIEALQQELLKWNEKSQELAEEQDKIRSDMEKLGEKFAEQLENTEWESVFRSSSQEDLERRIQTEMTQATRSLESQRSFEAVSAEQEGLELLRQAREHQQQMRQRVQEQAQAMMQRQRDRMLDRVEIIESEGRGERERRQRIMNSLRQEVDREYQPSHQRYFEELLQR